MLIAQIPSVKSVIFNIYLYICIRYIAELRAKIVNICISTK